MHYGSPVAKQFGHSAMETNNYGNRRILMGCSCVQEQTCHGFVNDVTTNRKVFQTHEALEQRITVENVFNSCQ